MNFKKMYFLIVVLVLFSNPAFSWDATGHRIVAAIAYSQLTSQAKNAVDALTALDDKAYPPLSRFLYTATLPDRWRKRDGGESAPWHYVNTPWSADGAPTVTASTPNLLAIMQQSETTLTDKGADSAQKAKALAYVLHLAGDAHQPLHCINLFSAQFPKGDRGGNLFLIQDSRASNLHAYWDQAAIWLLPSFLRYPPSNKNVQRLAGQLQQRYPQSYFADKTTDMNINDWVAQSFAIAHETVYQIAPGARPSASYRDKTAAIAAQQLVLAGYRLGNLLNKLFSG